MSSHASSRWSFARGVSFIGALGAALAAVVLGSACDPFAQEGQRCEEAPCAFGLVCVEGICERPDDSDTSDGGSSACREDADCALDGNADGRRCDDGQCAWASCTFDVQCGTRVCDQGTCAPRQVCAVDEDCDEGRICDDDACRSPCGGDDDCSGLFQACGEDGRCRQQCFIDLLCFGGLCEDGVCVDPQCESDDECDQPGSWFCDGGRCESFLPCDDDGDCFDPNFRCNELGRCEERPTCERDDQCGLEALCIDRHCRPTTSCLVDEDACAPGQECVAGRCVNAISCRSNADCGANQVCARGTCRAETLSEAAHVVVETALGPCFPDGTSLPGTSACILVLFEGEQAAVRFGALDEGGAPVRASIAASVGGTATFTLAEVTREGARLTATAVGEDGRLEVSSGGVSTSLPVVVVPGAPAGGVHVLVIDEGDGAPVEGAIVTVAGVTTTTDASGLAAFALSPSAAPATISARAGARGVALAEVVPVGDFRLALPADAPPPQGAAGVKARVTSSGDELGPVGIGFALPSVERLSDVSAQALFGAPIASAFDVPILGALPLPLPAAATLSATLPLVGAVEVRSQAYVTTAPGPRAVTAFEGRSELDVLFGLLGSGDEVELILDLALGAEAMDILTRPVGVLEARPLVPDADDLDGDGNTAELRPDFDGFESIEVVPTASPNERVGIALGPVPAGARSRVFVAAGLLSPGYGFVPTGLSALSVDDGAPRQVKVSPPVLDGLTAARRALVVEALFDDARRSRLLAVEDAFAPALDLGEMLAPPSGVNILDGVTAPNDRLLLLPPAPGATTYRVTLEGSGARWHLYAPTADGSGKSVLVDAALGGTSTSLGAVAVMRFPGSDADEATRTRFTAGQGPAAPAEEAARAYAESP